jgi:hypothetical protein
VPSGVPDGDPDQILRVPPGDDAVVAHQQGEMGVPPHAAVLQQPVQHGKSADPQRFHAADRGIQGRSEDLPRIPQVRTGQELTCGLPRRGGQPAGEHQAQRERENAAHQNAYMRSGLR